MASRTRKPPVKVDVKALVQKSQCDAHEDNVEPIGLMKNKCPKCGAVVTTRQNGTVRKHKRKKGGLMDIATVQRILDESNARRREREAKELEERVKKQKEAEAGKGVRRRRRSSNSNKNSEKAGA